MSNQSGDADKQTVKVPSGDASSAASMDSSVSVVLDRNALEDMPRLLRPHALARPPIVSIESIDRLLGEIHRCREVLGTAEADLIELRSQIITKT
jgi:hypothetical protein